MTQISEFCGPQGEGHCPGRHTTSLCFYFSLLPLQQVQLCLISMGAVLGQIRSDWKINIINRKFVCWRITWLRAVRGGPVRGRPLHTQQPAPSSRCFGAVSRISCLSSHAISFSCSAGLKLRFRSAFSEGCYWGMVFTARVMLTASGEGQAGRGRWSRNLTLSVARAYLYLFITIDTTLWALLKSLPAPHAARW